MINIKPMENYFATLPSAKLAQMLYEFEMATTKEERTAIYNITMNYIATMDNEQAKQQKWIKIFKKAIDKTSDL